jgi:hypothetical protein
MNINKNIPTFTSKDILGINMVRKLLVNQNKKELPIFLS